MKYSRHFLLLMGFAIVPSVGFAQDALGNSPATDAPTPTATVPTESGNITLPALEALAAIQQQRSQLTEQFTWQLQGASPEARLVLIGNFRQQLADLLAPLESPPLTLERPSQLSAQEEQAAQQSFLQSLPVEQQPAIAAMQQRQQLAQQLVDATPEDRLTIIAQMHQLMYQQTTQQPDSSQNPASEAASTQAQAGFIATLPPDQQAAMQAMAQRLQSIQAAMQLPPDQRAAALQAIQAQAASPSSISRP